MEKPKFIRIGNRSVRIDAITYVEFLDSGRAMIIFPGLAPEKSPLLARRTGSPRPPRLLRTAGNHGRPQPRGPRTRHFRPQVAALPVR